MSKLKDAMKKVTVKKTAPVKEVKKPDVCTNCDASGLKCSACGAPDPVV